MWFSRFLKGKKDKEPTAVDETKESVSPESSIDKGVFYLYSIVGAQVLLVFGLIAAITIFGTVMATPLWVFLLVAGLVVFGAVYLYRKIRRQFRKLRDGLRDVNLQDRNYEISIMGGMLTMRVEQNSRKLLEAPHEPTPTAIVDAEVLDNSTPN